MGRSLPHPLQLAVRHLPHDLATAMPSPSPRALLEREGCDRGKFQSGCRAVTGDVKRLGGGYWRLEMRLGLVLGYGNAFGVESGPECWGGGGYPPPLQAIPCPPPCKEAVVRDYGCQSPVRTRPVGCPG